MLGQEVDGRGGVVAVAVAHLRDRPLLLLVHRRSGAIVWDVRQAGCLPGWGPAGQAGCRVAAFGGSFFLGIALPRLCRHALSRPVARRLLQQHATCRAERILCSAPDEEDEPSKPTCACWVGERANCFALGYDDGSVLVYGVPPAALQGEQGALRRPARVVCVWCGRWRGGRGSSKG